MEKLTEAENEAMKQKTIAANLTAKLQLASKQYQSAKISAIGGALSSYIQGGGWW